MDERLETSFSRLEKAFQQTAAKTPPRKPSHKLLSAARLLGAMLLWIALSVGATPHAMAQTLTINGSGGGCPLSGATGGLKIYVSNDSQYQVERCTADGATANAKQYFDITLIPPSTGIYNMIFLRIGTIMYGANNSFASATPFTTVSHTGGSASGDGTVTTVYKAVQGGLTYTVTQVTSYVFPNDFYTVNLSVQVPAGNTEFVRLYSWTDLKLNGNDNGFCSRNAAFPEYMVGVESGSGFYGGYRQRSVANHWTRYYCGRYSIPVNGVLTSGIGTGILPNTIDINIKDVGAAVQWDVGTVSNTTFLANYDFVFAVGKPTLTKRYGPADGDTDDTISVGASTSYTFTISNVPGEPAQAGMAFTETLPANVSIVGTPAASQCGGTVAKGTSGGRDTITLTGGTLVGGTRSCDITMTVTSNVAGVYPDPATNISGVANLNNIADATLTVTAPLNDDHGDAPIIYGDPTHTIAGSLKLGANAPDAEATAAYSANAQGDDGAGTDDEDGVSSFPALTVGATSYSVPAVNITAAGSGTIHAWIDFDRNGVFTWKEYASVTVTNGVLSGPLTWPSITVGSAGVSYARLRFTSTTLTDDGSTIALDERSTMAAADGEVEDYSLLFAEAVTPYDYGDAPASFGAPRHAVVVGMRLGAAIDGDADAQPTANAQGDDAGTPDDEDGVSAFPTLVGGTTSYAIPAANISATGTGTIHAWIDFNKNGVFEASEYASTTVAANVVAGPLSWSNIVVGPDGTTYARLRFTSAILTDTAATGALDERSTLSATNGEVEDYAVAIASPTTVACNLDMTKGYPAGTTLTNDAYLSSHGVRIYKRADDAAHTLLAGNLNVISHAGDADGKLVFESANYLSIEFWQRDGSARTTSNVFSIMSDTSNPSGTYSYFVYDVNGVEIATGTKQDGTVLNLTGLYPNMHRVDLIKPGLGDAAFDQVGLPYCWDRGDAPASYGEPVHLVNPAAFRMGAGAVDVDPSEIHSTLGDSDGTDDNVMADTNADGVRDYKDLPALAAGATSYSIPAATLSAIGTGRLWAWIDFNQDGKFSNTEFATVSYTLGTNSTDLSWPAITVPTSGPTYMRFRYMSSVAAAATGVADDPNTTDVDERSFRSNPGSSTPGATKQTNTAPNVAATDGEVEDYLFIIGTPAYDHGDAPASYGDPTHVISGSIKLGAAAPDSEATAATPLDGTGDGADEDGVSGFPTLTPGATGYSIPIANITATGTGTLHGWIDFNKDGVFTPSEYASVSVTGGVLDQPLAWPGVTIGSAGTSYARLRFTSTLLTDDPATTADERAASALALDGEVEDYAVAFAGAAVNDYGDAPASYGAPAHKVVAGFKLGATIDAESAAQPNAAANGDGADEDGLTLGAPQVGQPVLMTASVPGGLASGGLSAWFDWNRDGDFLDAGEKVLTDQKDDGTNYDGTLNDTQIQFLVNVPTTALAGQTYYARFRLSTQTGLAPDTGVAPDGEVEDYAFTVAAYTPPAGAPVGACAGPNLLGNGDFGNVTNWAISYPAAPASGSYAIGLAGLNSTLVTAPAYDNASGVFRSYVDNDGNLGGVATLHLRNETTVNIVNGQTYVFNYDLQRIANSANVDAALGWVLIDPTTNAIVQTIPSSSVNLSAAPTASWANFGSTFTATAATGSYKVAMTFKPTTSGTGLVYDYYIDRVYFAPLAACDYGDAPASFGTPLHALTTGVRLGAAIDTEAASVPGAAATGDDLAGTPDDEDGVSAFPALYEGATSYSIPAANITASGSGTLRAWIDFDKDGQFSAAEKAADVTVTGGVLSGPLNWTSITVGAVGPSYARLRLTSTALSDDTATTAVDERSTAGASGGEVEDYAVAFAAAVPADRGDAPATYGDPTHAMSGSLKLGANAPDAETAAAPGTTALGDDTTGSPDDEDGVSFFPILTAGATSYSIPAANVSATGTGTLRAWIDFNKDGQFSAAEKSNDVTVTNGALSGALSWSSITVGAAGTTYARLRFTSTALSDDGATAALDERATAAASDGEVEDYALSITPSGAAYDYSDAPASYGAPRMLLNADGRLGANIDAEGAAQPNAAATGDDTAGVPDDEDGVSTLPPLYVGATRYTIGAEKITATGNGRLYGWLDVNRDGVFTADEGSETAVFNGVVNRALEFGLPAGAVAGATYLRLRYATAPSYSASWSLQDDAATTGVDERATGNSFIVVGSPTEPTGEVEDYAITVQPAPAAPAACNGTANGALVLSGTATLNGSNEIELTQAATSQAGGAWSSKPISLLDPFSFTFKVNLGARNGADGIGFAFQRAPAGPAAVGRYGGALGLGGLTPAVGIEFDTFTNNVSTGYVDAMMDTTFSDHTVIYNPVAYGTNAGGGAASLISSVIPLDELEDGRWREVRIDWNPTTQQLAYTFDGALVATITRDLINTDFGGNPVVYYGFTASTGDAYNLQKACVISAPPAAALDYSDAPATYGAPSHFINGALKLGATAPDAETAPPAPLDGTGDGADEDGVTLPALAVGATSYSIPAASISATGTGTLHAWIDFNKNGVFTSSEYQSVTVTNGVLSGPLTWPSFTAVTAGTTYARFRFASSTLTDDTGTAAVDERASSSLAGDGEVEDYALTIAAPSDRGDAPATYGDPTHVISGSLKLGANAPDAEAAAAPGTTALGDDTTGSPDDEDGLTAFPTPYAGATNYSIPAANISATGTGTLYAWVDFNRDGAFAATEAAQVTVTNGVLSGALTWSGLTGVTGGQSYARLRFTSAALADVAGTTAVDERSTAAAPDGEVEDYALSIVSLTCDATANPAFVRSGTATLNGSNEIVLTTATNWQAGGAWSAQPISLANPFSFTFKVYLGTNDAGADGIAFAFHRAPAGSAAVGGAGASLGVGGLDPAIGIEFDTYSNVADSVTFMDIANDHTVIYDPAGYIGANGGGAGSLISPVVDLGNIEDGNWHVAQIDWNPTTKALIYSLDGVVRANVTRDLIATDFLGNPMVYYGFAASTGGAVNEQKACVLSVPPPVTLDFGDAPATYGTPSHAIVAGMRLGANAPDAETAPPAPLDGAGDGADEDGAFYGAASGGVSLAGQSFYKAKAQTVDVRATGASGKLSVWFDWNRDGDFLDAGEQVAANAKDDGTGADLIAGDGVIRLSVTPPAGTVEGASYARFRWTTDTGVTSISAAASDGEIEDYAVKLIAGTPLVCNSTLYQVASTPSILRSASFSGSAATFADLGTAASGLNGSWGYNKVDNFIYGAVGNTKDIWRVGADGVFTKVGTISGLSPNAANAGDVTDAGHLITKTVTTDLWAVIDLNSPTFPVLRTFTITGPAAGKFIYDVAWNPADGMIYAIASANDTTILKIDTTTGVSTTVVPASGNSALNDSASTWFTASGQFISYNNNDNAYYVVNLTDGSTTLLSTSASSGGASDGAGCRGPDPIPTGAITGAVYADDDLSNTKNGTEAGFPNVTVKLYFDKGTASTADDVLVGTRVTNASGVYLFDDVNAAVGVTYRVEVDAADPDIPVGRSPGTPNPVTSATVTDGGTTTISFGFDVSYDLADAPASYGDPSHLAPSALKLGAAIDADGAPLTPRDGTGDGADDDGVSAFPTLNAGDVYYKLPAANITATGTGTLRAWIDFDKNGAFTASEQASVSVTNGALAGDLIWTGVIAGSAGTTYARLRFTSSALADDGATAAVDERATLAAADGEVEDYALPIAALPAAAAPGTQVCTGLRQNFIDMSSVPAQPAVGTAAPVTFNVSGGAKNFLNASATYAFETLLPGYTTRLGAIGAGGGMADPWSNATWAGVVNNSNITSQVASHRLLITLDQELEGVGFMIGDVDYNVVPEAVPLLRLRDGTGGVIAMTQTAGAPVTTDAGNKIFYGSGLSPMGSEGYLSTIGVNIPTTDPRAYIVVQTAPGQKVKTIEVVYGGGGILFSPVYYTACRDFGDVAATYGTPAHRLLLNGPRLGAAVDEELAPAAPLNGTGDDATGADDEDGVTLPATLLQGVSQTLTFSVTGAGGKLTGWVDWNRDGDFADAGEQIITDVTDNGAGDTNPAAGTIAVSLTPPALSTGASFARFRWSTTAGLTATAAAADGEVEDYAVSLLGQADLSLTKTASVAAALPGAPVAFTLTVSNAGPAPASGVVVSDLLPPGFAFVSSTTANGAYVSGTGLWTLASAIPSGGTASLTVNATMGSAGAILRNRAWISASDLTDPDSDPATGFSADDKADGVADDDEAEITVGLMAASAPVCNPLTSFAEFDGGVPAAGTPSAASTAQNGDTLAITNALPLGRTPTWSFTDGASTLLGPTRTTGAGAVTTWTLSAPRANLQFDLASIGTLEDHSVIGYLGATPVYPVWFNMSNGAAFRGQYGEILYDPAGGPQAGASVTFPSPVDRVVMSSAMTVDNVLTGEFKLVGCKAADLSLTKEAITTTSPIVIGFPASFKLTVKNNWKYTVDGVVVTDLLPAGYSYATSSMSQGAYTVGTGAWSVGTLAGGASATITINTAVQNSAAWLNQAQITASSLPDPDSSVSTGFAADDLGDGIADDDEATASYAPIMGAGAVIPPPSCPAGTATLDWDSATWTAGSLTHSWTVGGVAVNGAITLNGGALVAGAPNTAQTGLGDLTAPERVLFIGADPVNQASPIPVAFAFGTPVDGLRFKVFDLDGLEMIPAIRGYLNGRLVAPILNGGSQVSISGNGAASALNVDQPGGAAGSEKATLRVAFDQPVDRVEIDHGPHAGIAAYFYLHDLSFCSAQRDLTFRFAPDRESTLEPGDAVVYGHTLDVGADLAGGALSFASVSDQGLGWLIYRDNGDGHFGQGDTPWVNGSAVAAGTGQMFWAVSQTPTNLSTGWRDATVITASILKGVDAFSDNVTDVTSVSASATPGTGDAAGEIVGEKLTALDANCDGTADGGDPSFAREAPVAPGQCAVYRILFSNSGGAPVTNVVIRDATPSWTTFLGGSAIYLSTPAGLTAGAPILPVDGGTGEVAFPFSGALPPGPQGTVQFSVRLE